MATDVTKHSIENKKDKVCIVIKDTEEIAFDYFRFFMFQRNHKRVL